MVSVAHTHEDVKWQGLRQGSVDGCRATVRVRRCLLKEGLQGNQDVAGNLLSFMDAIMWVQGLDSRNSDSAGEVV